MKKLFLIFYLLIPIGIFAQTNTQILSDGDMYLSEPQLWLKLNKHLYVGTEYRISNILPDYFSAAIKWNH